MEPSFSHSFQRGWLAWCAADVGLLFSGACFAATVVGPLSFYYHIFFLCGVVVLMLCRSGDVFDCFQGHPTRVRRLVRSAYQKFQYP